MVMSVLNNLQLISEALQALVECASLGALRRRDVNTVFCSARAVYNEMVPAPLPLANLSEECCSSVVRYVLQISCRGARGGGGGG